MDAQLTGPSDAHRYAVKTMATEKEDIDAQTAPSRNLLVEITGTIASMILGAFLGLMVGGNGLGFVSFVVLCSFMGWVVWVRRKQSILVTVGICVLLVVVWWPFGLMLRELGRGLY